MRTLATWTAGGLLCGALLLGGGAQAAEKTVHGFMPLPRKEAADPAAVKEFSPLARFQTVGALVQEKCLACHTRNLELPFYARMPGVKEAIERDYKDGLRAMDLRTELLEASDAPVSEVALAKMEWVILNNSMPPAKFAMVHWGSTLTDAEKKAVLDWVRENRARHYAVKGMAPARANEPVQMLPVLPFDPAKAELGRQLFNDKRLSGDNTLACANCHALDKGGTDQQRFSEGVRKQFGDINAPSVFNAAFNARQFWNGRAANLQEQAAGPPFNPIEMDSKDWNQIIAKLAQDAPFTAAFAAVYPGGWTGEAIADAIAEYEKTLVTPNSPFDKWLAGKDDAISPEAVEGYQRFKAYRCASCHVGKTLGGQSFEYMDLKKNYFADRGNPLGSDEGLKAFTGNAADLHKFKVPNLRNIEHTAPYMHDGSVTTLDEAIRIMGVYLSGIDVSAADRQKIAAFLRTLSGEYQGKPLAGKVVEK